MAALSLLIFTSLFAFSQAMTSITAMSKDQIACTMCSSCDNPCQPILSPPPPVPSPPPPPTGPNCPPPPSPPSGGGGGGVYYFSPPPPAQTSYYYPPPYGGGAYYLPTNPTPNPSGFPTPPPPNPIMQYFPFYFHTPPPASPHDDYNSAAHPILPFLLIIFSIILFFL